MSTVISRIIIIIVLLKIVISGFHCIAVQFQLFTFDSYNWTPTLYTSFSYNEMCSFSIVHKCYKLNTMYIPDFFSKRDGHKDFLILHFLLIQLIGNWTLCCMIQRYSCSYFKSSSCYINCMCLACYVLS